MQLNTPILITKTFDKFFVFSVLLVLTGQAGTPPKFILNADVKVI